MLRRIIMPIGLCLCTAQTVIAEVKNLRCEPLSFSINVAGQTHTVGKSELEKTLKSWPKKCRSQEYSYGNGVINDVPFSQRCKKAFIKAGMTTLEPVGYPMKYDLKNNIMTWAFKGETMDPSFGTLRQSIRNKLNLETMIITQKATLQNVKVKTDGPKVTTSMTSICE